MEAAAADAAASVLAGKGARSLATGPPVIVAADTAGDVGEA
ncbi:MAG: hypothetical protein ACTHNZ_06810 [Trinickia sp.]